MIISPAILMFSFSWNDGGNLLNIVTDPKKMIRGHHNHHMNNNSKDSLIYFSLFGNKFTPTNWDEYNRKPV